MADVWNDCVNATGVANNAAIVANDIAAVTNLAATNATNKINAVNIDPTNTSTLNLAIEAAAAATLAAANARNLANVAIAAAVAAEIAATAADSKNNTYIVNNARNSAIIARAAAARAIISADNADAAAVLTNDAVAAAVAANNAIIEDEAQTSKLILQRLEDISVSNASVSSKLTQQNLLTDAAAEAAHRGYVLQTSLGKGPKPNFTYTVKLSLFTNIELICIASLSIKDLEAIVNTFALMAKKETLTEGIYQLDTFILENGQQRRFELKECDVTICINEWASLLGRADYLHSQPNQILQIYVADVNNILPDEEGYIVALKQPAADIR